MHIEDLAALAEPADYREDLEDLSAIITGYFFARQSIGYRGGLLPSLLPRLLALPRGPDHGLRKVGRAAP